MKNACFAWARHTLAARTVLVINWIFWSTKTIDRFVLKSLCVFYAHLNPEVRNWLEVVCTLFLWRWLCCAGHSALSAPLIAVKVRFSSLQGRRREPDHWLELSWIYLECPCCVYVCLFPNWGDSTRAVRTHRGLCLCGCLPGSWPGVACWMPAVGCQSILWLKLELLLSPLVDLQERTFLWPCAEHRLSHLFIHEALQWHGTFRLLLITIGPLPALLTVFVIINIGLWAFEPMTHPLGLLHRNDIDHWGLVFLNCLLAPRVTSFSPDPWSFVQHQAWLFHC